MDWDECEGQRFMFPVAACTCGGTAPGFPQHEVRCGFEDDEED